MNGNGTWKTNLNLFDNERLPQILENGRQSYFYNLKMSSIISSSKERQPHFTKKEDGLKKRKKPSQLILPGFLSNTTTKSKLAQLKKNQP
jgi:hypothetical protein